MVLASLPWLVVALPVVVDVAGPGAVVVVSAALVTPVVVAVVVVVVVMIVVVVVGVVVVVVVLLFVVVVMFCCCSHVYSHLRSPLPCLTLELRLNLTLAPWSLFAVHPDRR